MCEYLRAFLFQTLLDLPQERAQLGRVVTENVPPGVLPVEELLQTPKRILVILDVKQEESCQVVDPLTISNLSI